ncbi:MAG TPA: LLM class flavin-dependent oxidoreductase [Candidatus Limnocylindrales bacterium]|nr:LLM class flavin-dependent oxidoreductase [Candidatus Limnocylindrales bacterium]
MKLGLFLPTETGVDLPAMIALARRAEDLGYDSAWVPEAYGTDAVSILGALAATTSGIGLGTGIVNVFSRTPALLAQTATTLDQLSGGRFRLGLGTSGHQVIAGWHGMAYEHAVRRLREAIEIVRTVMRRDAVRYEGEIFHLGQGIKLMTHPIRPRVPIYLATLTPAGLRLTGELADGWMPTVFSPDHLALFRSDLEAGARLRGGGLEGLDLAPSVPVAIDDDRSRARDALRPWTALYVGGMGSHARNFYNQTVRRYGFEREALEIQQLYLGGKKLEAIARVPDALVDAIAIAGPPGYVRERLQAYRAVGVTSLLARVHAKDQAGALRAVELLAGANR